MSLAHRHPIFPRVYPYISRGAEKGGEADRRRELFAGLQDRAMEVAAGHGLNFAYKIHRGKRIARDRTIGPAPPRRRTSSLSSTE